jgi:hypothetical protein
MASPYWGRSAASSRRDARRGRFLTSSRHAANIWVVKKPLILTVLALCALSVGCVSPKPDERVRLVSKSPQNFTEGVWIKKYPFDYACFKFETPDGIKIVCDPFEMDDTVPADIVIESHQDGDHNDAKKITGLYKLIQSPGEYEEKGIRITGIGGRHNKGDTAVTNTVFVLDVNGIKIAHFASQGQVPSEEMWAKLEALNGIDVMLVQAFRKPEYGYVKMTVDECCSVIDRLGPKIVIPEHGTDGISEDFANHYHSQVERVNYDGFVVTKEILKSIEGHLIIDMDNKGPAN